MSIHISNSNLLCVPCLLDLETQHFFNAVVLPGHEFRSKCRKEHIPNYCGNGWKNQTVINHE